MNETIKKIDAISETIGNKLSGFLSDTGYANIVADTVHLHSRELIKAHLLEMAMLGQVTFHDDGTIIALTPRSYDEATADFMKEYPQYRDDFDVKAGDRVLYARKHSDIGLFSVGQYVTVKLIAASDGAIQVSGSHFCTWINRTTFFDAFDPAPMDDPDFQEVKPMKDRIADGEFDGYMAAISGSEVWNSPVDGRPHFIDKDGWIYARGYRPVSELTLIKVRERDYGISPDPHSGFSVTARSFDWENIYRFKLG